MDTPVISAYELEHYYKRTQRQLSTMTSPMPFHVNPVNATNANTAGEGDTSSETESEARSKIA